MSLDEYMQITEKEKQEAVEYFLDLIHDGKRDKAIKYYQSLNRDTQKYIRDDPSGQWELWNSLTELEA